MREVAKSGPSEVNYECPNGADDAKKDRHQKHTQTEEAQCPRMHARMEQRDDEDCYSPYSAQKKEIGKSLKAQAQQRVDRQFSRGAHLGVLEAALFEPDGAKSDKFETTPFPS